MKHGNTWALVLATDDGTGLAGLTTDHRGCSVPKEFCSLNGGHSLLQASLMRAQRIVSKRRVCTVVARGHEYYWRSTLSPLPAGNVFIQPRNCGTGIGLLLGVLRILQRDPAARIIVFPADHYVCDEKSLSRSLRSAAAALSRNRDGILWERILLVGITPDSADPEIGYIVPGAPAGDGVNHVAQLVEKPTTSAARDLIARGSVWNSFILAAHGTSLIAHIRKRHRDIVDGMGAAIARDVCRTEGTQGLDGYYQRLPTMDLSRTIVQGAASALCVFPAPACGWTSLDTPRQVSNALHRLWSEPQRGPLFGTPHVSAFVNLASQYARCARESTETVGTTTETEHIATAAIRRTGNLG
jgi:mannose-1-phosphate guanylyltransferase